MEERRVNNVPAESHGNRAQEHVISCFNGGAVLARGREASHSSSAQHHAASTVDVSVNCIGEPIDLLIHLIFKILITGMGLVLFTCPLVKVRVVSDSAQRNSQCSEAPSLLKLC